MYLFVNAKKFSENVTLHLPSSILVEFVKACESVFLNSFENVMHESGLRKKLLTTILECNAGNGLLCGRDDCVEYFSFRL